MAEVIAPAAEPAAVQASPCHPERSEGPVLRSAPAVKQQVPRCARDDKRLSAAPHNGGPGTPRHRPNEAVASPHRPSAARPSPGGRF